ncbi:hypothetical protein [Nitratifractor sp.]|uniref:hypothetical protein n=1 Tax=Nitratifractor sp. TaxID=2268144 RepID=UPI0025E9A25E|nr:hypothetical protein [Nitratifractor sp.]
MRKVRVSAFAPDTTLQVVGPEEWFKSAPGDQSAVLYYKHRLDDAWFQTLLEELSLEKKRLSPERARRLIVAALLKGEAVDRD